MGMMLVCIFYVLEKAIVRHVGRLLAQVSTKFRITIEYKLRRQDCRHQACSQMALWNLLQGKHEQAF